jgi:hypothetical protein
MNTNLIWTFKEKRQIENDSEGCQAEFLLDLYSRITERPRRVFSRHFSTFKVLRSRHAQASFA